MELSTGTLKVDCRCVERSSLELDGTVWKDHNALGHGDNPTRIDIERAPPPMVAVSASPPRTVARLRSNVRQFLRPCGACGANGRPDVGGCVGNLTTIPNIQRAYTVVADSEFVGVGPVDPVPVTVTKPAAEWRSAGPADFPLLLETLPPFSMVSFPVP